jgi:hypothetical protein
MTQIIFFSVNLKTKPKTQPFFAFLGRVTPEIILKTALFFLTQQGLLIGV